MALIKLAYPIVEAHGYLDRDKDIEGKTFGGFGITCTATGKQVTFHRKNKRTSDPSMAEQDHRSAWGEMAKRVSARMQQTSGTYLQDIAAWTEQRSQPGGYKTFKMWLWSQERAKAGA